MKQKQDQGIGHGHAWTNVMQVLFPDEALPSADTHRGSAKLSTYGLPEDHRLYP